MMALLFAAALLLGQPSALLHGQSGQQNSGQKPIDRSPGSPGGVVWQSTTSDATNDLQFESAVAPAAPDSKLIPAPLEKVPAALASATTSKPSNQQVGTTEFTLAAQPDAGGHFDQGPVQFAAGAVAIPPTVDDFSPTPIDPAMPYDSMSEIGIYEGKRLYANQRPLIEIGRPWYQLGQLAPGSTILGRHNLMSPQFIVYGDYRLAYASNDFGTDSTSQLATELNLNLDLRLTATERLTAFIAPLDNGGSNTRWLMDEDRFVEEFDADIEFGMLEGDVGAIAGGAMGQTLPFDLPFAVGVMPMLLQNGVWMDDAVLGAAFTIPARNSAALDISNMDTTFFAAFDNINSDAFPGDNDVAKMYGIANYIESMGGYIELDYAFIEDRNRTLDRSYHNVGIAYSRRYGRFISNSIRVITNAGQSTSGGPNTADGVLFLIENSLITSRPSTFVPYFNMFAGFDRPQSAARSIDAGGILRNTGILFETDGMTNYPTLDPTANDTWGAAFGLNIMTDNFDQQLILELAALQTMGDDAGRNAVADQYGAGVRYQIPLNNAWILRADGMYGVLREVPDVHGARLELRHKF